VRCQYIFRLIYWEALASIIDVRVFLIL
jgi:hypothetical protein